MKKNILFLLIAFSCITVNAQQHQRRDSTHRVDTSFAGVNEAVAKLIHAPVLSNPNQVHKITPHQQYCFDVMMEVEIKIGRISLFAAVFINTTDGYVGYTKPSPGGAINTLFPDAEDFRFYITSYKLENIYTYHNSRASRGNGIDHNVSTSNTEQIDYRDMNDLTAAPIQIKDERRSYVYGTMNARAYKRSAQPTLWFINFADNTIIFPASLQVQKFLGALGVGLIQTDHGNYILCEKTNGNMFTKITNIERCHVCFDPSGFKTMEADFYVTASEKLRAESDKINRDEEAINKRYREHSNNINDQPFHNCQTEEMAVIAFRRENNRVQQENLRKAQQGNLLQDRNAQKAFLNMDDPLIVVRQGILQAQVGICNERPCAQELLSFYQMAEAKMIQIDRQYPNIAEAAARKSELLLHTPVCN